MIGLIQPPMILRQGHAASAHPLIMNGLQPQNLDVSVIMRGGTAAVGDVLQFDMLAEDAAVSTATIGADNGIWKNVSAPTTNGIAAGMWNAVATEAIAATATGAVRVWGIIDAYVIAASGSVAIGSRLVPTTAKNFDLVSAAGEVYRALGMAAVSSPSSRALGSVFVAGIGSFGMDPAD